MKPYTIQYFTLRKTRKDPKGVFEVREKINDVHIALQAGAHLSALALALTLPDICGKVEYPELNGKLAYIGWFDRYALELFESSAESHPNNKPIDERLQFDGKACYSLRCAFLHAGEAQIQNDKLKVDIDQFELCISSTVEGIYVECYGCRKSDSHVSLAMRLDIRLLCKRLCDAAQTYYEQFAHKTALNDHYVKILNIPEEVERIHKRNFCSTEEIVLDILDSLSKTPPKSEFLFALREYLVKQGLQYQGYIMQALTDRMGGKLFDFPDHLRGLIYALLSAQRKWKQVEPHLLDIDRIFFNYNKEKIKRYPAKYFENHIRKIKCGNQSIEKQMKALHTNIAIMEQIAKRYGSLDNYVTSKAAYLIVKELSDAKSPYKLERIGPALAWEYLRNVGIDGAKPDVHLRRFFGKGRMNYSTRETATEAETIKIAEQLQNDTGMSLLEIDNLIWSFCSSGYGEICAAKPKCEVCPIIRFCK